MGFQGNLEQVLDPSEALSKKREATRLPRVLLDLPFCF